MAERRHAARSAARHALRLRGLRRACHIGVYLAYGAELSTAPLIAQLARAGKQLYAPAIDRQGRMAFTPLSTRWRKDALGIACSLRQRPKRHGLELDLVIVPLVGFTAQGIRLGAGGGYYDRSFATRGAHRHPRLLGYAYAVQQCATLPREPFDVSLDQIVTDRGIFHCLPHCSVVASSHRLQSPAPPLKPDHFSN